VGSCMRFGYRDLGEAGERYSAANKKRLFGMHRRVERIDEERSSMFSRSSYFRSGSPDDECIKVYKKSNSGLASRVSILLFSRSTMGSCARRKKMPEPSVFRCRNRISMT